MRNTLSTTGFGHHIDRIVASNKRARMGETIARATHGYVSAVIDARIAMHAAPTRMLGIDASDIDAMLAGMVES